MLTTPPCETAHLQCDIQTNKISGLRNHRFFIICPISVREFACAHVLRVCGAHFACDTQGNTVLYRVLAFDLSLTLTRPRSDLTYSLHQKSYPMHGCCALAHSTRALVCGTRGTEVKPRLDPKTRESVFVAFDTMCCVLCESVCERCVCIVLCACISSTALRFLEIALAAGFRIRAREFLFDARQGVKQASSGSCSRQGTGTKLEGLDPAVSCRLYPVSPSNDSYFKPSLK